MRAAIPLLGMLALLAACGGGSSGRGIALRIELRDGAFGPRTYSLRCDPTGGDAPRRAAVCRALEQDPALLERRGGRDHSCPYGPATTHVDGRFGDRRVDATFSVCVASEEPEAARWLQLLRYEPRRKGR